MRKPRKHLSFFRGNYEGKDPGWLPLEFLKKAYDEIPKIYVTALSMDPQQYDMSGHFDVIFSNSEIKNAIYSCIQSEYNARSSAMYEKSYKKIPLLFWAIYLGQPTSLLFEFMQHPDFPKRSSKEVDLLLFWSAAFNLPYFKQLSEHFKRRWDERNLEIFFNHALNYGQFNTLAYLSSLMEKPVPLFADPLKGNPSFVDALANAIKSIPYQPNTEVNKKVHALIKDAGGGNDLRVSFAIRTDNLTLFTRYSAEKNWATAENVHPAIKRKSIQILKELLKQEPNLSAEFTEIAHAAIYSLSREIFDLIHAYAKEKKYSYPEGIIVDAVDCGNRYAVQQLAHDHPTLVNALSQELACFRKQVEMVRHLLESGVKPSTKCWLVFAHRRVGTENDCNTIVQLLLHAGLKVSKEVVSQVWDAIKNSEDLELIQKVADELIALAPELELKEAISTKLASITSEENLVELTTVCRN